MNYWWKNTRNIVDKNEAGKLEKIRVYQNIETLDGDFFEKSIDEIIEELTEIKNQGHENLTIQNDSELYEDSYISFKIKATRLENDKEFEERMNLIAKDALQEHINAQKKEKEDKELYEKLKARFEN